MTPIIQNKLNTYNAITESVLSAHVLVYGVCSDDIVIVRYMHESTV